MILYSIIVPIYRPESCVESCLMQLSNNLGKDAELILIVSGSSIIPEMKSNDTSKVTTRFYEKHLLAGQARNIGASLAEGSFLIFVDSDIFCDQEALANIKKELLADAATAFSFIPKAFSNAEKFSTNFQSWIQHYRFSSLPEGSGHLWGALWGVKAEAFKLLGGFNSELSSYEDFDMGWRLNKIGIPIKARYSDCVVHLKKYTLLRLIKDWFHRAYFAMLYWLGTKKFGQKGVGLPKEMVASFLFGIFGSISLIFYLIAGGFTSYLLAALIFYFFHVFSMLKAWKNSLEFFKLEKLPLLIFYNFLYQCSTVVGCVAGLVMGLFLNKTEIVRE